jgi:hypothetical protein
LGNRDGNGPVLDDEVPRNLVKTPESSLWNIDELNATTDSAVLEQTLLLLQGLKSLMTSGDGAQSKTAVQENL